jgi:hypothetical protein
MKVRRRPPGHIRCVDCRKEGPPSRKDSIYCAACAVRLYQRIAAATGEDIDGNALLSLIFAKNHEDMPSEVAAGDSPNAHAGTVFEVRHAAAR